MKKGFSILLIFLLFCFTTCLSSIQAKQRITTIEITIGDPIVVIDEQPLSPMKAVPFINNGRTMFPGVRGLAEILGCKVTWLGDKEIIVIQTKKIKVEMQIDNKIAKVNGQEVVLDSPMDKRTFIPIRFVMESFGATVSWDPTLHKVRIVYTEPLD